MAQFINPYNFISLSEKPVRQKANEGAETYTGYIEYLLTTKSRLFIPNTSSDKAFRYEANQDDDPDGEHKLYDFYSFHALDENKTYDEEWFEPGVPGSEVRGMFRSIYETLTNSCLSVTDGEKRIGKRTVEHFKPGVLKRGGGGKNYLHEAKDAVYRNKKDFSDKKYKNCNIKDGSKVSFDKNSPSKNYIKPDVSRMKGYEEQGNRYQCEGYLLKGSKGPDIKSGKESKCYSKDRPECIMMQKGLCEGKYKKSEHCYKAEKHCAHVFWLEEKHSEYDLNEQSLRSLEIVLEQYLNEDEKSYSEYKEAYRAFIKKEADGIPVYYSKIDTSDYIMLSPACITREVYENTVNDIVKDYEKCNPSVTKKPLCPACSLFGIVNDKDVRGSKIRFTDLHIKGQQKENKDYYNEGLLTLEPLSAPHLANTEFYLKEPIDEEGEVLFWTYDYYTLRKKDGQVVVKKCLPEISGRKFYWNNCSDIKNYEKRTKFNQTVRTVKPDVTFTGRIYFDGIQEWQLQQLIYIIQYTADGKHGFKLGGGKPLGLGSVQLGIESQDKIKVRKWETGKYSCDDYGKHIKIDSHTYAELHFDKKAGAEFELITRYLGERESKAIHYPTTKVEGEEGFQWFVNNKIKVDNGKKYKYQSSRLQIKIQQKLPEVSKGIPWMEENDDNPKDTKVVSRNVGAQKSKEAMKQKKIYKAIINSEGRTGNKKGFLIYDIGILDDAEFSKKKCILSAPEGRRLNKNQEVEVVFFKGITFNLRGRTY